MPGLPRALGVRAAGAERRRRAACRGPLTSVAGWKSSSGDLQHSPPGAETHAHDSRACRLRLTFSHDILTLTHVPRLFIIPPAAGELGRGHSAAHLERAFWSLSLRDSILASAPMASCRGSHALNARLAIEHPSQPTFIDSVGCPRSTFSAPEARVLSLGSQSWLVGSQDVPPTGRMVHRGIGSRLAHTITVVVDLYTPTLEARFSLTFVAFRLSLCHVVGAGTFLPAVVMAGV
jgi:hypothetical protein